ncbi:MAG: hypothetical protein GKC04_00440 [Methanomicrobiales archaeon]|nr:hypothetical protein [Methanomicrobiales archaeon]
MTQQICPIISRGFDVQFCKREQCMAWTTAPLPGGAAERAPAGRCALIAAERTC